MNRYPGLDVLEEIAGSLDARGLAGLPFPSSITLLPQEYADVLEFLRVTFGVLVGEPDPDVILYGGVEIRRFLGKDAP